MRFVGRPVLWVVVTVFFLALTVGGVPQLYFDGDSHSGEEEQSQAAVSVPLVVVTSAEEATGNTEDPGEDGALDTSAIADAHTYTDELNGKVATAENLASSTDHDGPSEETLAEGPTSSDQDTEVMAVAFAFNDVDGELLESGVGGPTEMESEGAIVASDAEKIEDEPIILTHIVAPGETLGRIASKYGIDQNTIIAANDIINVNSLAVGEKLTILTVPGALHVVRSGESLWNISRMYDTGIDAIAAFNGLDNPERIHPNQQLVIPGEDAARIATSLRQEVLLSAEGRLLRAFSWPTTGRISSNYGARWGSFHHGLDIAVPSGTPVKAAARGTVTFSGVNGGYGNLIVIDHGNGVETRYAHNSRLIARVGQKVSRGEIVAYSGNTGRSTGPHLHFEIRLWGQSYDPLQFLR